VDQGHNSAAAVSETLNRLAAGCRILAMEGHNDMALGHMSLRDPQGRGLWLKKAQRGLDEILGPSHFVLIDFQGRQLENHGFCHSEWPIHSEIMLARPDVHVVGHTHAHYSVLFSAANEDLKPLNHEGASLVGRLARFNETAGLINTRELGRALAASLGDACVVLMKNHGITFVGSTPEEATLSGIYIERACKAQIEIAATGWAWSAEAGGTYDRKLTASSNPATDYHRIFFDYFARKLERIERRAV
jgi:L-fuculose-phosphate aldolase